MLSIHPAAQVFPTVEVYTRPRFYPSVVPQHLSTSPFGLHLQALKGLEDFFSSPGTSGCQPRHHQYQRPVALRPRFAVRETETAYEIDANLPGVKREHVNIASTGPETLVVKGRLVRTYRLKQPQAESGMPAVEPQQSEPQAQQPEPQSQPEFQPEPAAETEPEKEATDMAEKDEFVVVVNNHHATVEDDPEDDEVTTTLSQRSSSPVPTPADSPRPESSKVAETIPATEVAKPAAPAAEEVTEQPKGTLPKVVERTVGQFTRTFDFPQRVNMEEVTAKMDEGVLRIVVPKARAHVNRNIAIV